MRISPSSDVDLPTLLLDCNPNRELPLLVYSKGKRGRYLALSYVWGGTHESQRYETTSANKDAYSSVGIPLSVLPQTIHDAIYVTQSLGFEFLWVDSLCIVQDSGREKIHEIGCMHNIYRYAYLTIIAASAGNVSEGFLQLRTVSEARDTVALPFLCPSGAHASARNNVKGKAVQQVGKVRLQQRGIMGTTPWRYDFDITTEHPRQDPTRARGWCLQELYMSLRALIFTSGPLQFKCQTTSTPINVCNSFLPNDAHDLPEALPDVLFHRKPRHVKFGSNTWKDLHHRWHDIVSDYTSRTIGRPSDKLVACGAIAQAFQKVLATNYLAGLWRPSLLQDLMWRKLSDCTYDLNPPIEYGAPSWSWASVDRPVTISGLQSESLEDPENLDDRINPLAEVVDCQVVLKNPELPFGEVIDGFLLLRAALIQCHLLPPDIMRIKSDRLHQDVAFVMPPSRPCEDWGVDPPVKKYHPTTEEDIERGIHLNGTATIDRAADQRIERPWAVLLTGDSSGILRGLLVMPVNSESSNLEDGTTYRRIGSFETDNGNVGLVPEQGNRYMCPLVEVKIV